MVNISISTLIGSTSDPHTSDVVRFFRRRADRGDGNGGAADGHVSAREAAAYIADAEAALMSTGDCTRNNGTLDLQEMYSIISKLIREQFGQPETTEKTQKLATLCKIKQTITREANDIKHTQARGAPLFSYRELYNIANDAMSKIDQNTLKEYNRPITKYELSNLMGQRYTENQIDFIYSELCKIESTKSHNPFAKPTIHSLHTLERNCVKDLQFERLNASGVTQMRNQESVYYAKIDDYGETENIERNTNKAVLRLVPYDEEDKAPTSHEKRIFAGNPAQRLIDDCQAYYAPPVDYRQSEQDNINALRREMDRIAQQQGGSDGKMSKFVISDHSYRFGTLSIRAVHGPASTPSNPNVVENIDVSTIAMARAAAEYVEPSGQLVLSACNVLPNIKGTPLNFTEYSEIEADRNYRAARDDLEQDLKNLARQKSIYIVVSTRAIQGGGPDQVTGGMVVITPRGEKLPYSEAKAKGYVT